MPEASAFSISSLKALAVMAMIGTVYASGRGRARMRRVASYPSITGIWMSIKIKSKASGELVSKTSKASCPFCASVSSQPSSFRMDTTIIRLISLSSTARMRFPFNVQPVSAVLLAAFSSLGDFAIGKGMETVNTVPFPSWLSTEMEPPIFSASVLLRVVPRPVPFCEAMRRSCSKALQMFCKNSGLMPQPVSAA